MSSVISSPIGPASAAKRGTQSAAHFSKLEALPENSTLEARLNAIEAAEHNPVTLDSANSSWLTLAGQALKLTLVAAGVDADGIVTQLAQSFAGAKTFLAEAVFSAGLLTTYVRAASASLMLRSDLGAGATDVCVKAGTSVADASVNAAAKIWAAYTGLGATEVLKAYILKDGSFVSSGSIAAGGNLSTGTSGGLSLGLAGIGVPASSFPVRFGCGWGLADTGAAECFDFLSTTTFTNLSTAVISWRNSNVRTGPVTGKLTAGGEFESGVNGAGIVLKSPDGTRWRITVSNAGAVSAALA